MEFGLVTVARAAQIPAARATIDSARQSGFTGAVHAVAPLDEIAALADHRLALVDRPRAGAPDDAKHPTEADLVRGHRYSTSIIAATRESWASLGWWRDV